jgi:hypothetical protein
MAAQCCVETSDFLQNGEEPYPEGYTEAIKDCTALVANLLNQAINGEAIRRCWDCSSWVGRCLRGKFNQIARSKACDEFSPRLEKRRRFEELKAEKAKP